MTYEEAEQYCLKEMEQFHAHIKNQDLSPEEVEKQI
jgi:hypothetical protein